MKVSFSGPGSSGKSTLLEQMREILNDSWHFVPEVTRKVRREYGVNINENGGDETQLLIGAEHLQNGFRYSHQDNVLMDRCIIDGVVYTSVLRDMGQVSNSVVEYFHRLAEILLPRLDIVFYTEQLPIVDDGERSTDKKFHEKILREFDVYLETVNRRYRWLNVQRLPAVPVGDRIKQITDVLAAEGYTVK